MATVVYPLRPRDASYPATNFPQYKVVAGTNFPVESLAFDGATEETCYFSFRAAAYGSGNITLRIRWYADSGTSGDVIWGAAIAAITPDTDTQDVETKSFATAQTVTDSHLGTTAQRVHTCTLTVSNLDSVAADDECWLKFYRDADAAGDTLNSIDAQLISIGIEYSDS